VPTEEVAFRTQPVISDQTLIRRIPPTEQLASLEPASQAISKIGVQGQWIKVRDASEREGYVAAWYVKYASGSTATAEAAATPPAASSGPTKVKTTVEGVAFRRQPVISDMTLIRRLSLGTPVTIAEAGGESKIGANNQWLKVRDSGGTEGYIAAWFLAR
jgi:SH3-like domain-containing protein